MALPPVYYRLHPGSSKTFGPEIDVNNRVKMFLLQSLFVMQTILSFTVVLPTHAEWPEYLQPAFGAVESRLFDLKLALNATKTRLMLFSNAWKTLGFFSEHCNLAGRSDLIC